VDCELYVVGSVISLHQPEVQVRCTSAKMYPQITTKWLPAMFNFASILWLNFSWRRVVQQQTLSFTVIVHL